MMTHDDMIAIIRADQDGKAIESRKLGEATWMDLTGLQPLFNFQGFEFRVKFEPPKPREWWLVVDSATGEPVCCGVRNESKPGRIHVREILVLKP